MKTADFNLLLDGILNHCEATLKRKADEYAVAADRLHNFIVAAGLQGTSPEIALGGMLAKHIVSIYDMINSKGAYVQEIWDEKIGDAINYLILLRAIVSE